MRAAGDGSCPLTPVPRSAFHAPFNRLADWAEPSAWSTAQHLIELASTGDYQLGVLPGDTSYSTGLES